MVIRPEGPSEDSRRAQRCTVVDALGTVGGTSGPAYARARRSTMDVRRAKDRR
jgi:hypothetical protein